MGRYNNTERLGVDETARIVDRNFKWIFREQPIADVGVDAIIEQVDDGNPTGKYIALQIKSGESNFHITKDKITYYLSRTHYNYWLNLSIPILLIAYLPETGKTYWQHICKKNVVRTPQKWKLDIPKSQEFNEKSKGKLENLLPEKYQGNLDLYQGKIDPETIFDYSEGVDCIPEATGSLLKIAGTIKDVENVANKFKTKFIKFNEQGLSDRDAQVKASLDSYGAKLNAQSLRLGNEIRLFAEFFAKGFYAYEQVITYHYIFSKDTESLREAVRALQIIPFSVCETLQVITEFRDTIVKIPTEYRVLNFARKSLLQVLEVLISELTDAQDMVENIIRNTDSLNGS